jgi:hypothetical protein
MAAELLHWPLKLQTEPAANVSRYDQLRSRQAKATKEASLLSQYMGLVSSLGSVLGRRVSEVGFLHPEFELGLVRVQAYCGGSV